MSTEVQEIATEGGHWYLPDGTPFYTIMGKTTGRMRPVTIKDARAVGAVPSVTTITKIIRSQALERYFEKQMFEAVVNMEWADGDDQDALFKKARADSKQHAARRADEGGKLHGAIEQFLRGESYHERWKPHIEKLSAALAQYGIDIKDGEPEKSFAHSFGFGGKSDWHERSGDGILDFGTVLDFKTKDKLEVGVKTYGFHDQAMQLSAYRKGLEIPRARCINAFLGCEDGQVYLHEWPEADLVVAWKKFNCLLEYWQLDKGYFPQIEATKTAA